MKKPCTGPAAGEQRGTALLMALMVLLVLVAIVFQLNIGTGTDAQVTRNDLSIAAMDLAIESAMLETYEQLANDAQSGGGDGAEGGGDAGGAPPPEGPEGAGGAGGEGEQAPSDSHEDSWGQAQRTEINEIELRIMVQDEDSKLNVLTMLSEDEEEAEKAFERVTSVIDLYREGSREDVDTSDARSMAQAMLDHMMRRSDSVPPRPTLVTDDEEEPDRGLPLTLREFESIEPFHPGLFRDYRDDRGMIVHSLSSYLTVWSSIPRSDEDEEGPNGAGGGGGGEGEDGESPDGSGGGGRGSDADSDAMAPGASFGPQGAVQETVGGGRGQGTGTGGQGDGGGRGGDRQGGGGGGGGGGEDAEGGGGGGGGGGDAAADKIGIAVNINTAPPVVLKSLFDDRDVNPRWWDNVIEYRNLEEEDEDDEEGDDEPVYNEYGEEVIQRQIFDSIEEIDEVDGTDRLDARIRAELDRFITTESHVFSIYISARRVTGDQSDFGGYRGAPREGDREDMRGNALVRTIRSVVWRTEIDGEAAIVPIVRWEVVDYTPFEVLDYPDDDR